MRLRDNRPAPTPTQHRPGSLGKLEALIQRWERGEQLRHPNDAQIETADGDDAVVHFLTSNAKPISGCRYLDERMYRELEGVV